MERNTEFTNKECLRCIRRPFSIGDIVLTVHIYPKLLEALYKSVLGLAICGSTNSAELVQAALGLVDLLNPILCLAVSFLELLLERGEPWVHFDNAYWDQLFVCQSSSANIPVPSLGSPLAAPCPRTEFSEFSFVASILQDF